jgi:hypothetical protein
MSHQQQAAQSRINCMEKQGPFGQFQPNDCSKRESIIHDL